MNSFQFCFEIVESHLLSSKCSARRTEQRLSLFCYVLEEMVYKLRYGTSFLLELWVMCFCCCSFRDVQDLQSLQQEVIQCDDFYFFLFLTLDFSQVVTRLRLMDFIRRKTILICDKVSNSSGL